MISQSASAILNAWHRVLIQLRCRDQEHSHTTTSSYTQELHTAHTVYLHLHCKKLPAVVKDYTFQTLKFVHYFTTKCSVLLNVLVFAVYCVQSFYISIFTFFSVNIMDISCISSIRTFKHDFISLVVQWTGFESHLVVLTYLPLPFFPSKKFMSLLHCPFNVNITKKQ